MHTNFGYLNQGNPLNIGENEAQACVNCGLDRGWIEYKEYHTNNEEPNISADIGTRHFEISNGSIKDNGGAFGISLSDYFKNTSGIDFDVVFKHIEFDTSSSSYTGNPIIDGVEGSKHIEINSVNFEQGKLSYKISPCVRPKYMFIKPPKYVPVINRPDAPFYSCWKESGNENYSVLVPAERNPGYNIEYKTYEEISREFITLTNDFINKNIQACSLWLTCGRDGNLYEEELSSKFFDFSLSADNSLYINIHPEAKIPNDIIKFEFFFSFAFFNSNPSGFYEDSFILYPNEENKKRTLFYAITVEEDFNGIKKSTEPYFFSKEFLSDGYINLVYIRTPKEESLVNPSRNIRYSLFRIPYGGNEYLLDGYIPSKDFATGLYQREVQDKSKDTDLTDLLTTAGNSSVVSKSTNVSSIVIHKDMLFAAIDNILWFSKQGIFDQFPAKNFFVFQNHITGLVPYNSNLMVLTEKEAYVIYGMNEQGFVVAKVDFNNDFNEEHSSRAVYDHVLTCNSIKPSVMEDKSEFTISKINSQYGYDIGNKAKKYLKEQNSTTGNNRVLYNRFYIIKFTRPHATATSSSNLVYDAIKGGFVIYEKPHDMFAEYLTEDCWFRYKTKEYLQDGKATARTQSNKALVVRAKGLVKIRAYGDNEVISEEEIDFGDVVNTKTDISMIPTRYSTFSVEFLGKSKDAQIHGWDICNA